MMKKTLLALALIGASQTAMADSWLYAGGNIGLADSDERGADSETAYGFHVGTGILPIIGLEAGFWDLGDANGGDLTTVYAAIKPSLDLGPVHLYGKVGVNKFDIDGGPKDDDGYDLMYGAGAEWFVLDNLSLGLAYTNFGFDHSDVDNYSVSATFHFL